MQTENTTTPAAQQPQLSALIDAYQRAVDELEAAKEHTKTLQALCDARKEELAAAMVADEITLVARGGYSYSAVPKTRYSKRAGADVELFAALREAGYGDIIKESVNAQTLQAACKELAEYSQTGELPAALSECVSQYSFVDIQKRKKA